MTTGQRENFGNRLAVIMAMAGSAIGLGNIWRFPYMVGEHGGAAFVLVYIGATLLVSLPVFLAEVTLGRMSRSSAYCAMSKVRPDQKFWKVGGFLAVFIPLVICSYYSVIGGWSVAFLFKSCTGAFVRSTPEAVNGIFGDFISSTWYPIFVHLLFLGTCAVVVAKGVKSGIERFSKVCIPMLFVLIVAMTVYSISLPGARAGVRYLVCPNLSELNARTFTYALGQSFYSLSLGMGAIITYGSYVHKDENIVASSVGTAISDLLFALLAGFAIMPAVFAAGIEPGAGPGLIFQSIPFIFSTLGTSLPLISMVMSVLFFLTIVVAAMTSCVSLLEVGASFLNEHYGMVRWKACLILFFLCGGVGVLSSLSFGPLKDINVGGKGIFDMLDWFSSNVMLLVLAFLVVLFLGFFTKKEQIYDEITNGGRLKFNKKIFSVIYFLIKWVAPEFIVLIFITNFIL